jgi:cellobiose-specific phosphotransferase system component IIA
MSLFSGLKKLSLKKTFSNSNIKKFGIQLSGLIPYAGGAVQTSLQAISDAHDAKKANRQAEADAKVQEASTVIGDTAGTIAGQLLSQSANKAVASASREVQQGAGQVGAQVVDFTINEWLKKHWSLLLGVLGGLIGLFVILPRILHRGNSSQSRNYRR